MSQLKLALEHLQQGKMVILVDDEDRENEGDLVLPAQHVTPEAINFLAKHARGLICLSLEASRVEELQIPMMTTRNQSQRQTAFTVSIEARDGISTGISAADRAHTVKVAINPRSTASDIITPGHVFPLRAVEGGVLVRAGHTEGSLDLMRMAGLQPAAVICEIMNEDGTMARMRDLREFAARHGEIPIVAIKELISHRMENESLVKEVASSKLPTAFGEFTMHAFVSLIDGAEHLALVRTKTAGSDLKPGQEKFQGPALVRVHSECLTGDALLSARCDCGEQLKSALKQIAESENGVLVYMRRHEGRGIGLLNKIKAYALQDQGMDTVEANRHLGFQPDLRHYGIGAQILRTLGVKELKLLTNNPKKVVGLDGYGLKIVDRVAIEASPNPHNSQYLTTKREKLGHQLSLVNEVKPGSSK
ncbi:MAG: bifunctional 3,4-dihydroxy-2-butanone-4-phosphate synthase/GTP cyclohydrolase II [Bacteriovoracia bacterium]